MKNSLRPIILFTQLFFCLIALTLTNAAQEIKPDARQLTLGEKIERTVTGQEVHLYLFELKKGQVVKVDFLERGADVFAFAARDADGQKVSAISNAGSGFMRESFTFIAEQAGVYGIVVRAQQFTKANISAKYEMTTSVSDSDSIIAKQRIQAEKLLEEAYAIVAGKDVANIPQAISKLEESVKIRQTLGDRYWEAISYFFIGSAYATAQNFKQAETPLIKALSLLDKVNNKGEIANVYFGLGEVYAYIQNEPKAKTYLAQAIEIYRSLGDNRLEQLANTANLADLANLNKGADNIELAGFSLTDFDQKLAAARAKKDTAAIVSLWAKNFLLYVLNDDDSLEDEQVTALLEKAEDEGLFLSRRIKDRNAEMRILFSLGLAYEAMAEEAEDTDDDATADTDKSQNYLLQSLLLSKILNDPLFEGFSFAGLKSVFEEKNDKLSIFFGKKAINAIQNLRQTAKATDKETQQLLGRQIEELYEEFAGDLISDEHRLAEALQLINLGRDQEFFDFKFTDNQKPKSLALTPREEENSRLFDQTFDAVAARYNNLAAFDTAAAANQLNPIITQLKQNFSAENSERDVVRSVPDLEDMREVLQTLSLKTGKKHAAIYVSADSTQILLITETGIRAFAKRDIISEAGDDSKSQYEELMRQAQSGLITKEEALKRLKELQSQTLKKSSELVNEKKDAKPLEFLAALEDPTVDPRPAGATLYRRIFKSTEIGNPDGRENTLENELARANINVILWSLRGPLRYIPVAALYDDETKQYLVQKFENVMFTRANKERFLIEPKPWANGMGFAASAAPGFEPLESADAEVYSIFGNPATGSRGYFNGQVFINRDFSKQSFSTISQKKPDFIHIASHFSFVAGDARKSFLVLGDGDTLPLIDLQQKINFQGVDLLTLSACETAAQQADANGKEIDGFAELAQRLGASSVIATLWSISDIGTSRLMEEFYRLRQANPVASKSEILRLAQLSLLNLKVTTQDNPPDRRGATVKSKNKTGITSEKASPPPFKPASQFSLEHPYYWAAFVLFGNSNGEKSSNPDLFPKLAPNSSRTSDGGNFNSGNPVLISPTNLIGTWEGLFERAQYVCTLEIERIEGNNFYGTLRPRGGSIAVSGAIDPVTRRISFVETKIISLGSNSSWSLGSNRGSFSNDGNSISGTGLNGSTPYQWSFTRTNPVQSSNQTYIQPNNPTPSGNNPITLKELQISFEAKLFDETIRKGRIFITYEPDNKEALGYLGYALLVSNNVDEAVIHLARAIRLGQPIPFFLKRGRQNPIPVLGQILSEGQIIVSSDGITIVDGDKRFQAPFTALTGASLENYGGACPVAAFQGTFVEVRTKSEKTKTDKKDFALFPLSASLIQVQQGNLTVSQISCSDPGVIPNVVIRIIAELRSRQ